MTDLELALLFFEALDDSPKAAPCWDHVPEVLSLDDVPEPMTGEDGGW